MISTARRLAGLRAGARRARGRAGGHGLGRRLYPRLRRRGGRRFADGDRPGTAIFATADEITVGLVEVLRDRGIAIPGDVSLVGFDDVVPQHLFAPPVTAMRQPVADFGRRALTLLAETDWQEAAASPRSSCPSNSPSGAPSPRRPMPETTTNRKRKTG